MPMFMPKNITGFAVVGLGGTFDHLHAGHERLLEIAFRIGKKVAVGLATDALLGGKQFKENLQSYDQREAGLREYAKRIGRAKDLVIIPLEDPVGPAGTDPSIEAHVSSEETFSSAQKINEIRIANSLKPLILVMIPMVLKENGERYSSTTIRESLAEP
jgi:pantetheine-phosphate adenylyltransferase